MVRKKFSPMILWLLIGVSVQLVAIRCVEGKVVNMTSGNITNVTIEVEEELATKIEGLVGTEDEEGEGDVGLEEVKVTVPIPDEYDGKAEKGSSCVAGGGTEKPVTVGPSIVNENDAVKLPEDATTNNQEIENGQKKGPCENADVRICLLNECDWIDEKCVDKQAEFQVPGGLFQSPFSVTQTYENVCRLFLMMWENPPARSDPYIWMAFLFGTFTLAAFGLLWVFLGWWFYRCREWLSCCFRGRQIESVPNLNRNERRRRRRLARRRPLKILPGGVKVPVSAKPVTVPNPNAKRLEPHQLLSKFEGVNLRSPLRRENWPAYVGRTKEELERPSCWPYEGDEYSTGRPSPAATITRNPKKRSAFTAPSIVSDVESLIADSYKYETPAFEIDMEEPVPVVEPVVRKKDAYDDCLDDVFENLNFDSSDTSGSQDSTLVTFTDETPGTGNSADSLDEMSNDEALEAAEKSSTEANTLVITTDEIESDLKQSAVMPIEEPESSTNEMAMNKPETEEDVSGIAVDETLSPAVETAQAVESTVDEKPVEEEISDIQSEPDRNEMSATSNSEIPPEEPADISLGEVNKIEDLPLQTEETSPPHPSSPMQEKEKNNECEEATKL